MLSLHDFLVDNKEEILFMTETKFLALAGPQCPQPGALPEEEGYNATTVEQLLPIFRELGITSIVRLNRKYYNEKKFTAAGVVHLDLYFEDGSNPPEALLQKFLRFCEATPGAIAVRECCHVLHTAPFPIFANSAPFFFFFFNNVTTQPHPTPFLRQTARLALVARGPALGPT